MYKFLIGLMLITALGFSLILPKAILAQQDKDKNKNDTKRAEQDSDRDEDPDVPEFARGIDKGLYIKLRDEQLSMLRGLPYPKADSRSQAIFQMMRQENTLRAATGEPDAAPQMSWQAIGPAPIPNGQTTGRTDPVSGRVSSIAVHPTNPDIAYVGAAQGGVFRTLNGGATWTPLTDNALSLAIGAIAISPTDPSVVFVGTGEPTFSLDGFFGVGVYRITNADSPNPVVAGPLNIGTGGTDVFTGRSISEIILHPTNPNIMFVSTVTGVGGLGGNQPVTAPPLGLYRTLNALSGNPVFEKINIQGTISTSRSVIDIAIDPDNPNRLLAAVVGSGGDGGIYLTTNALDATPNFTRSLATGDGSNAGRAEFAVHKSGSTLTVYVASGTSNGTVYKSTDGGATFPTSVTNGFCNPQCFYDIAIAVNPTNANNVYLGGSPSLVFGRSSDGGATFPSSSTGLHVDTHAIAVAPSNPNIIYFGSDGGVWKSVDAGASWVSQNNSTLNTMQYQSISLHPTDRFFTIGGTQDNGTHFLRPDNSWVRATGGDGGQSAIDQNATDTTNVFGYHTFFNSSGTQIGYRRLNPFNGAGQIQTGVNRGCFSSVPANGIDCNDPVLFYAPLTRGPGNPNTIYLGTNRVYRSADRGDNHTIVSQQFAARVSAIGISPNNDSVRLAGTTNGQIFLSTTPGATVMTDVTGSVPSRYVTRFAIDPTNNNVAYLALGGFGLAAGQHIYKTTNLLSGAPTWTASGFGIPDVPVNALVIDPANTNVVFAGSDIGVFRSTDAGASWQPFSDGLPRVAVFDMALQNANRFLRAATHGRGVYELNLNAATRAKVADFDGDGRTDYSVYRSSAATWFALRSSNNSALVSQFGIASDITVPADYDGDRRTDIAVYRDGTWFVINSSNGAVRVFQWGIAGDRPVAADYDGDGKADFGVFRNGTWFISRSSDNGVTVLGWGISSDVLVPADYEGDGKADVAVFRNGTWFVLRSTGGVLVTQWGTTGDIPVTGDYDGDNKADFAVFRGGTWFVLQTGGGVKVQGWGLAADLPAQGDYDGDGKTDFGVFRNGTWFVQTATANVSVVGFGLTGDTPLPARQNP